MPQYGSKTTPEFPLYEHNDLVVYRIPKAGNRDHHRRWRAPEVDIRYCCAFWGKSTQRSEANGERRQPETTGESEAL